MQRLWWPGVIGLALLASPSLAFGQQITPWQVQLRYRQYQYQQQRLAWQMQQLAAQQRGAQAIGTSPLPAAKSNTCPHANHGSAKGQGAGQLALTARVQTVTPIPKTIPPKVVSAPAVAPRVVPPPKVAAPIGVSATAKVVPAPTTTTAKAPPSSAPNATPTTGGGGSSSSRTIYTTRTIWIRR